MVPLYQNMQKTPKKKTIKENVTLDIFIYRKYVVCVSRDNTLPQN